MPMKKLLLSIIGIIIWTSGYPCSCDYIGNFLKASEYAELIAIIKVKGHNDYFPLTGAAPPDTINQPLSATFEIIEILKGKEERKEVKVFGDDGVLCRPYIDKFEVGKYYIVGLLQGEDADRGFGIKETAEDYQVLICGEFWIEYNPDSNMVEGLIKKKRRKATTMTLDAFKASLARK